MRPENDVNSTLRAFAIWEQFSLEQPELSISELRGRLSTKYGESVRLAIEHGQSFH